MENLRLLLIQIKYFILYDDVFLLLIPLTIIIVLRKRYEKNAYFQITHLSYSAVKKDIGKYGEYLTYKHLKNYEKQGAKFLFNVYIPKESGETTEIDVLMLCSKGLFVFESKNYSGWIFGSMNSEIWAKTFSIGYGRSEKIKLCCR